LKHSAKIRVNEDSTNRKKILDVESRPYNGTYQINTFDMDELLDNLRDNVYPILRGGDL